MKSLRINIQSNTNHSKHDQPQHHSTKRYAFYVVTNESRERISARMRTNSRHIKQYVQATSKSVFIKHDDEKRLNRLSIGWVEQIERRMLYIGMERTRISRIASSNGQSSDGNRVALVYNAIPIDDRRWKTTFICKVSRIHTFLCIFFCVQRVQIFCVRWMVDLKIDFFLYFMNMYMFIFINEIKNRDFILFIKKTLINLILKNKLSLIGLNWTEDI